MGRFLHERGTCRCCSKRDRFEGGELVSKKAEKLAGQSLKLVVVINGEAGLRLNKWWA
jgi:hypothetical protein